MVIEHPLHEHLAVLCNHFLREVGLQLWSEVKPHAADIEQSLVTLLVQLRQLLQGFQQPAIIVWFQSQHETLRITIHCWAWFEGLTVAFEIF